MKSNAKSARFQYVRPCLSAFFACFASMRACRISSFHPFTLISFLLYLSAFSRFSRQNGINGCSGAQKRVALTISGLFTFFYLCADYSGLLAGLTSRLFQAAVLTASGIGLFLLFSMLLSVFFTASKAWRFTLPGTDDGQPFYYRHFGGISFSACLIGWLPYLFNNFPGVMTVDSLNQYAQIIGALPFSNHHPWLHTQLIRFFYIIGMALTNDEILSLGLYTVFQMLVMAGIVSYLSDTLKKLRVRPLICILSLAFYALLPYNGLYMVTMWKDILFSGMTLLFSLTLLRFLIFPKKGLTVSGLTYFLYLISGFCMCLFRSNGFYAVVITLPFVLFLLRSGWKRHLPLNLILIAAVLLIKGPVMNACRVEQPDFVEALSIPLQMTARVYADQEPTDPADDELWNRIMDTGQIPQVYQDFCSDHMKNLVRFGDQKYLTEHKAAYLKLWLAFGARHPLAYLRGYLDATKGFWYPDVPNIIGSDERIAENPYGLAARPLIHNRFTIKLREILFKLPDMLPLYGLLFSIGMMAWLAILLAGKTFLQKEKAGLLVFLPNFAVYATLMAATPVNREFRYAYPLLLSIPLFLCVAFIQPEGDKEDR